MIDTTRREFAGGATATLLLWGAISGTGKAAEMEELYGLIGEMKAAPGKRAELVGYLLEGTDGMPGNLAYLVAEDAADPDTIWITEVWHSKADHANSLQLPGVQAAIAKARPIIAGFGRQIETRPVGMDAR
ncbi:MAG: antibiotic biosynthesis monooxygenase [Sphingomonadales bacterium 32-68-7]|nr:MAG: antibiotic biosynthesis monooxygenase [Sphingomonadales bacterium 12-68-11]OYX08487.1 MAG: antibiotic biosynthesis monooxygenase [Sphingomonadales bacterium 32-68-7]